MGWWRWATLALGEQTPERKLRLCTQSRIDEASFSLQSTTARLQCSRFKESGTCTNGLRIKRDDVERLTLSGLRRALAQPIYLAEHVTTYNEERTRLARAARSQRSKLERRKGEIERELRRAIDAIIKAGIDPNTVAGDIKRLEAERADIDLKLAEIDVADNVIALHPAALERYRTDLDHLAALSHGPNSATPTNSAPHYAR